MRGESGGELARECWTVVWLLGWGVLLWSVHRPWGLLGGWVEPRLIWTERAVLYFSPWLGFLVGGLRRRGLLAGARAGSRSWTVTIALMSLVLTLSTAVFGSPEMLGVVTTGLCGFAAGGSTAGWGLLLRPEIPELPPRRDRDRPRRGGRATRR